MKDELTNKLAQIDRLREWNEYFSSKIDRINSDIIDILKKNDPTSDSIDTLSKARQQLQPDDRHSAMKLLRVTKFEVEKLLDED